METPKKSVEDRAARGRLNYINHRLAEIKEEMERLKNERQKLRATTKPRGTPAPGKRV